MTTEVLELLALGRSVCYIHKDGRSRAALVTKVHRWTDGKPTGILNLVWFAAERTDMMGHGVSVYAANVPFGEPREIEPGLWVGNPETWYFPKLGVEVR